jgi:hypothetical protein
MLPIVLPFGHVTTADALVDRGRVGFARQRGTHHGFFVEFVLVLDGLEDAHNIGFQYHAAHDLLEQEERDGNIRASKERRRVSNMLCRKTNIKSGEDRNRKFASVSHTYNFVQYIIQLRITEYKIEFTYIFKALSRSEKRS